MLVEVTLVGLMLVEVTLVEAISVELIITLVLVETGQQTDLCVLSQFIVPLTVLPIVQVTVHLTVQGIELVTIKRGIKLHFCEVFFIH